MMYSPNSCRTALSFSVLSFFSTTILTAATRFSDIKKPPFPARGKKRVPRLVSNKSDSPLSRRAYPSAQVANIFKRHLPFGICLVFIINLSARKSKRYAHTFRYLCKYCGHETVFVMRALRGGPLRHGESHAHRQGAVFACEARKTRSVSNSGGIKNTADAVSFPIRCLKFRDRWQGLCPETRRR